MLVGVISDTHDNVPATRRIIRELTEHGVKLIIHLGDVVSPFTLRFMREEAGSLKFIIVKGNNDGDIYLLTRLSTSFGWSFHSEPALLDIDGRRLLLVHGYGDAESTERIVDALAKSMDVDGVLYGHTHVARLVNYGGKLVFNPGEACGYLTGRHTYGVLDTGMLKAEVLELKN